MDQPLEPKSFAVFAESIAHFRRAGTPSEQLMLQDRAWTMLREWTRPNIYPGSRIASSWLGEQHWRLQIANQRALWRPDWVAPLAAAAVCRGHAELMGTAVEPGELRHSAVWRVPTNADDLSRFFASHYATFGMVFPPDLSFAVHCTDGDFAVYAGPEEFVREALPPQGLGAAAMAHAIFLADPEATGSDFAYYDEIFAPYLPFLIE